MNKRIKQAVFLVFMLLLILPALQFEFKWFEIKKLGGDYKFAGRPKWDWVAWNSKEYQKQYERYVNDHIGFRELFLRSYNQVWFSLFRIMHAQDVVMGRNYCLYERNYILDYTGANFKGEAIIDDQIRKAKFVQDTLAKRNIHLVLFFAPGKASFFPENIPDAYMRNARPQTNYKYYIEKSKELGLNYFDMNAWFMQQKGKTPYPLYSNLGIHWSCYGVSLAFDSLLKYMGHLQGAPLPKMIVDSIAVTHIPHDTDNDLEEGLNLLFSLPHDDLAYPKYHFADVSGMKKPRVLTIGDSYWWNIFGTGLTQLTFNGSEFWFYNQLAFYEDSRPEVPVDSLDLQTEAEKNDFIILLATESSLDRFTYGFIDGLYDIYTGKHSAAERQRKFNEKVKYQETVIRNIPEWLENVRKKAEQQHVPLDTMIHRDAVYMVTQQSK